MFTPANRLPDDLYSKWLVKISEDTIIGFAECSDVFGHSYVTEARAFLYENSTVGVQRVAKDLFALGMIGGGAVLDSGRFAVGVVGICATFVFAWLPSHIVAKGEATARGINFSKS